LTIGESPTLTDRLESSSLLGVPSTMMSRSKELALDSWISLDQHHLPSHFETSQTSYRFEPLLCICDEMLCEYDSRMHLYGQGSILIIQAILLEREDWMTSAFERQSSILKISHTSSVLI
jgi:hypothetical protein